MSDVPAFGYYAGGEWKEASGSAIFEVVEPYSRKLMSRVAACGARRHAMQS